MHLALQGPAIKTATAEAEQAAKVQQVQHVAGNTTQVHISHHDLSMVLCWGMSPCCRCLICMAFDYRQLCCDKTPCGLQVASAPAAGAALQLVAVATRTQQQPQILHGARAPIPAQIWFGLCLPMLWQQQAGAVVLLLGSKRYSLFIVMQALLHSRPPKSESFMLCCVHVLQQCVAFQYRMEMDLFFIFWDTSRSCCRQLAALA